MTEPLSDTAFDSLAVVWFTALAVSPRALILVLSFGRSRISDTGVRNLRWMGVAFAVVALANLILA